MILKEYVCLAHGDFDAESLRVLLVDDSPMARRFMRRWMVVAL